MNQYCMKNYPNADIYLYLEDVEVVSESSEG